MSVKLCVIFYGFYRTFLCFILISLLCSIHIEHSFDTVPLILT